MQKILSFVVISVCYFSLSFADDNFTNYLQIRYRYEYDNNFSIQYYGKNTEAPTSDAFLLQRIRAGFNYNITSNILLTFGIQDSRAFDVDYSDKLFYNSSLHHFNNPYKDYTEPYDTYLQIKNILNSNWNLKIGRQILSYGNTRIFGPGEWGNSGRYIWDTAVFSYKEDKNFIDFFWGANIIHEPEIISLSHRKQFYGFGAYSHFELNNALITEPFLIFKYDTHNNFKATSGFGDYFSTFPGIRLTGKLPKNFYYDSTYVYQKGKYGTDDIKAWGAYAEFGKTISIPSTKLQVTPFIEYSYATGDGNPKDGIRKRFDGVFGAKDLMYGRMNLFDWSNLKDLRFALKLNYKEPVQIIAEFHRFWLANKKDGWSLNSKIYQDKTGKSGDEVGDEFDVVLKLNTNDLLPKTYGSLEWQLGYSHFWPGDFTKNVADDREANWYFLQLTYNFKNK